jgi:conjugal transfer pilus assembly protein TraF
MISKPLLCLFFSWVVLFACPVLASQESPLLLNSINNQIEGLEKPATEMQHTEKSFYGNKKQGWWWYQKELAKENTEEQAKRKLPEMEDYSYQQLWNMYPDDFHELLNTFMKKAVQSPDEKTVMDYLVMQDIARRKSVAFAAVMSYVNQKNQELGTQSVYPFTAPGQSAVVSMRVRAQEQTLASGKDQFALIMFTRQGCDFCVAQKSILEFFINKYGWPVRAVDMNENPNIAAKFNITMAPTIIMVDKSSGDSIPISVGVMSMSDLVLKLYRSVRFMRGEITPQQWFMHDFEKGKSNDPLKFTSQVQ